ncbi:hypothetical protein [Sinorhizobium sp. NFACC03]|uniref:hypothetical protein n=1 Tax=Sinorhizobium sp. NFACC03 TaxID=1566295 RepID=UPI000890D7FB|nr:hypothetical protein [Sinorhizobium sp. NFACC03]SDA96275.1 hypothetical protein SAMN03159448_05621 [Sinorhizobium sp. NFACC03]
MSVHRRIGIILGGGVALALYASSAGAHVKWFAPYIVGAEPQPVSGVLANPWFWSGVILVTVFFVATRLAEISALGASAHDVIDRATAPLWLRLDDYVRATVAAFFIAIFSVGGVYLTPDLKTPAEWVSWLQLLIAVYIFFRATMPLAGIGIITLWLLALRDYDIFHLFDYLALGLGVAAYLIMEPSRNEALRSHRFEALRWGLAVALMWSSLEKFAYPIWFYPLVEEKPFLTFGLPRDVFIPMAGVAEFTMGFGLLWTPLIRRLSAIALLVIFTAAVWPFGRIDLIGHGLIMAILVAVACDRCRKTRFLPSLKAHIPAIPGGIAMALVLFAVAYWGLHGMFYGAEYSAQAAGERATHSFDPDHPHGLRAEDSMGALPTKQ